MAGGEVSGQAKREPTLPREQSDKKQKSATLDQQEIFRVKRKYSHFQWEKSPLLGGTSKKKKNGIFWEFFPKGGGGHPISQNFLCNYHSHKNPLKTP